MQKFSPDSPFYKFHISSHAPLHRAIREKCPTCQSCYKYYCYNCIAIMPSIPVNQIPRLELPKNLIILKHTKEKSSKYTSIHACLLASSSVQLFEFHPTFESHSALENYIIDPSSTLIIYPTDAGPDISEIDPSTYKYMVFLDATWTQSKTMFKSLVSKFPGIRAVRLSISCTYLNKGTLFWRYQNKDGSHLSTIEAIYLACMQIDKTTNYDNLLYFYSYFYHLIQDSYKENGKIYSSKHRLGKDYIH